MSKIRRGWFSFSQQGKKKHNIYPPIMAHIHKCVVIENFAFRPCKAPPEQAIRCNREHFKQSTLGKEFQE